MLLGLRQLVPLAQQVGQRHVEDCAGWRLSHALRFREFQGLADGLGGLVQSSLELQHPAKIERGDVGRGDVAGCSGQRQALDIGQQRLFIVAKLAVGAGQAQVSVTAQQGVILGSQRKGFPGELDRIFQLASVARQLDPQGRATRLPADVSWIHRSLCCLSCPSITGSIQILFHGIHPARQPQHPGIGAA